MFYYIFSFLFFSSLLFSISFFQAEHNEDENVNAEKNGNKSMFESQRSQKNSEQKIGLISAQPNFTEIEMTESENFEKKNDKNVQNIRKSESNHIMNKGAVHEEVVKEVDSGALLKSVLSKELPLEHEKKHNGRMDMFCIKV